MQISTGVFTLTVFYTKNQSESDLSCSECGYFLKKCTLHPCCFGKAELSKNLKMLSDTNFFSANHSEEQTTNTENVRV